MSIEARVQIGGESRGSFAPGFDIRGNIPRSLAFFCPSCCQIWARIEVAAQLWQPLSIPCRQHHESPFLPGGSLWLPWAPEYTQHYPKEVLMHEFMRCLELIEQHPEEFEVPQ